MVTENSLYFSFLRRFFVLTFLVSTSFISLKAQDRCGTVEYNKLILGNTTAQAHEDQFENWLSRKLDFKNNQTSQSKEAATVVQIPLVIHIVHNNEPLGTGLNITDDQIQSQVDVINEDFRRLNADRANTPSNFVGVAADVEVEFVMAKRDPEGLATSGILRVAGTQPEWSMSDNISLKAQSYWPAEDYLNIWVTAISGTLLGYAQFPVSSELDGLEGGSDNALTDGIVVDYEVFGSIDKYPAANLKTNFAKGRTTTHEIGHFLGLRHTWGDTGSTECTTDYCDDTPPQSTSTSGCPSHPSSDGCSTSKMFQNYMDYTSDECMNLFTQDQNDRIRTILENSPRRTSLTTSLALLDPTVFDNDLGIFSVTTPGDKTCDEFVTPSIVVKNYGNFDANNGVIRLTVNGIAQQDLNADLSGLSQLSSTTVSFSEISLVEGNNILKFEILTVNNITDQGVTNNIEEHIVNIPSVVTADITEDFQNGLESMSIQDVDGIKTWEIADAPDGTTDNRAMFINYYDYENEGTEDWLLSQVMDFSSLTFAQLNFDYAHAQYPGRSDQLKILISSDCGQSFQDVFDKSGSELMTTENTSTQNFTPSSTGDWKTESIDLSDHIGKTRIQIAFQGINGFGNNIYLDNINLITSEETSIKIKQIDSPTIVSGSTTQSLNITVKNIGSFTINTLDISYSIDNGASQQMSQENLNITSGASAQLSLDGIVSSEGNHTITATISKPNGIDDVDVSDNSLSENYVIDLSTDNIPLIEYFQQVNNWVTATRSDVNWELVTIENNTSMYVNSAQNTQIGGQAWFVSPILDLSQTTAASLFFDISYALSSNGQSETLKVLLSEDGGLDNYPNELFKQSGSNLATYSIVEDNWTPEINNTVHWDSVFIDLSDYVGGESIRFAFQLTNGNGNNLYLDNIEFFEDANTERVDIGEKEVLHFPNPIYAMEEAVLSLIFNLAERQKASIRIFDLAGNLVFNQEEPYALNQTFDYEIGALPAGMLILSVIGETFKYNKRITVIR